MNPLIPTTCACLALLATAWGQEEVFDAQSEAAAGSPVSSWWDGDAATGTWSGVRPTLEDHGVEIFGGFITEVWGNTTGGIATGAVSTSLLDFGATLDLEQLVGWHGASASTTWLWLTGRDASADLVGNFLTISNIAGFSTLRMQELWFQQNLFDDRFSIRLGQIGADSEFIISETAGTFLNGTFGWPAFTYMNLPGGGPGYPMGTLGVRLAFHPTDAFTLLSAVFQGNVYDQNVNRHGFRWRLDGENGFLFLNEAQGRWNHRDTDRGLPGTAKTGVWFQTGSLADVLASTTQSGNTGWYLIVDQMFYRESSPGAPSGGKSSSGKTHAPSSSGKTFKETVNIESSNQGLRWFGRMSFAPQDRNVLGFYFDTGFTYTGLIPTRDADTIGLAFACARLGNVARDDLIEEGFTGVGAEMVLEFTYQARITPWLIVQPDLQWIIHPGGTRDLGNALVIGGRAAITF